MLRAGLGGLALAVLLCCATTGMPSIAHAQLVWTQPQAAASVSAPPDRVMLKFAGGVDGAHSIVVVTAPDGSEHQLGTPVVSALDVLSIQLDGRGPAGEWYVRYAIRTWDQHSYAGGFHFTVSPPSIRTTRPRHDSAGVLLTATLLLTLGIYVVGRTRRRFN